jgi:AAA domain
MSSVSFDDGLENFDAAPPIQPIESEASHQASSNRPEYAPFTGLPDLPALGELKSQPRWVAWKWEERDGKPTKPPVNPRTGNYASTSNPSTWVSYELAARCAVERGLPGVGYVLGDEDGDLTGIDLDKCISASGKIKPWAREILDCGETYAEISPSGRGIRLLARGKIPAAVKFDPANVELYGAGRYLTITGNRVEGAPDTINEAPHTLVALRERVELHKRTWAALKAVGLNLEFKNGKPTRKEPAPNAPAPRPGGIIDRATGGTTVLDFNRGKTQTSFWKNVDKAAMANLAAWVPTLLPTAQFYTSTGAYRVTSANLGRDLQEDLSIHPTGIRDWGTDDQGAPSGQQKKGAGAHTPISLVKQFQSMDATAAAHWLCERMGVEPATLGWRGGGAKAESERKDQKPGSRLTYFDDCDQVASKQWIMKGLIARGETSSWIAPPGKGKSALLAHIAIHVAAGKDWLNFRSKERCGVLYLAFERGDLTKRRFAAYKRGGFAGLPVAVHAEIIDLMAPECVETILGLMREAEEHYGVKIGLVVIDTYAKGIAIGGGDEDKAKDQGRCLAHLRRVQEASNAHIAIVGHTGKDESRGARGSNAHQGDVDLQVQISGNSAVKTAKVIKGNDQPEGTLLRFSMQSVPLGVDDDGEEITVWVIADDNMVAPIKEPGEWPPKLEPLREAIDEAVIEGGLDHAIPRGPTVKAAYLDAVRSIYRRRHPSEVEEGSKRPHGRADSALDRELTRARERHLIGSDKVAGKPIVWVATP